MSETKIGKVYLVSYPEESAEGGIYTTLWTHRPGGDEFTVHAEIEVPYQMPSREAQVAGAVASLHALAKKEDAEHAVKQQVIQDKINSLLALEVLE